MPVSLTWEKSTTYDVGLDLDFFNNRLSVSGDYYRRYTTDMYTASVALPAVYGTGSPKGNNAEMKTDGWELSLSWRDSFKLGGKPFDYSIKAMVWDSKSVITKYVNDTGSLGTVKGFIENNGGNFKLCGCWKVYGNVEAAERTFANYGRCRKFLCNKLNEGIDIYQALRIS